MHSRARLPGARRHPGRIDRNLLQLRRQHADHLDLGIRHQLGNLLQPDQCLADCTVSVAGTRIGMRLKDRDDALGEGGTKGSSNCTAAAK